MFIGSLTSVTGDANITLTGIQLASTIGQETVDLNTLVNVTGSQLATAINGVAVDIKTEIFPAGMVLSSSINGPLVTAWSTVDPGVSNTWVEVDKAA